MWSVLSLMTILNSVYGPVNGSILSVISLWGTLKGSITVGRRDNAVYGIEYRALRRMNTE